MMSCGHWTLLHRRQNLDVSEQDFDRVWTDVTDDDVDVGGELVMSLFHKEGLTCGVCSLPCDSEATLERHTAQHVRYILGLCNNDLRCEQHMLCFADPDEFHAHRQDPSFGHGPTDRILLDQFLVFQRTGPAQVFCPLCRSTLAYDDGNVLPLFHHRSLHELYRVQPALEPRCDTHAIAFQSPGDAEAHSQLAHAAGPSRPDAAGGGGAPMARGETASQQCQRCHLVVAEKDKKVHWALHSLFDKSHHPYPRCERHQLAFPTDTYLIDHLYNIGHDLGVIRELWHAAGVKRNHACPICGSLCSISGAARRRQNLRCTAAHQPRLERNTPRSLRVSASCDRPAPGCFSTTRDHSRRRTTRGRFSNTRISTAA